MPLSSRRTADFLRASWSTTVDWLVRRILDGEEEQQCSR
jgi:hypothetical protein